MALYPAQRQVTRDDDHRHRGVRAGKPGDRRQADAVEHLVDDAELVIEHQPEHGRIGDLADHHRREEGEAEQAPCLEQRRIEKHGEHRRQRDHDRHLDDQDDQRVPQRVGEGRIDEQPAPGHSGIEGPVGASLCSGTRARTS